MRMKNNMFFSVVIIFAGYLLFEKFYKSNAALQAMAIIIFMIASVAVLFLINIKNITKQMTKNIEIKKIMTNESLQESLVIGIRFNPNLISKLKGDHLLLFQIYDRLVDCDDSFSSNKTYQNLILLRRAFQQHILVEDVRFYTYLEKLLKDKETERQYVRALRRDMSGISLAVAVFCDKWIKIPVVNDNKVIFYEELKQIGKALTSRIKLEESSLYTLYVESI